MPSYTNTWNVQQVLDYIEMLGDSSSLPLKLLSWKTPFLLALTQPSRSADLSKLDRTRKQYRQDGLAFIPRDLAKQSRQGRPIVEFFFPSFPEIPKLCPVQTLEAYSTALRQVYKRVRGTRMSLEVDTHDTATTVWNTRECRALYSLHETREPSSSSLE